MPEIVTAKAGSKLIVEAFVSGKPTPVSKWKRGSDDIVTSDRVFIQKTPTTNVLMIKDVTRKDSGYYSLSAENSISKVNQILRIIIMGELHLKKCTVCEKVFQVQINCNNVFIQFFRQTWSSRGSFRISRGGYRCMHSCMEFTY